MLVEPEKSPAGLKFPRSFLARARMVAGAAVITFGLVLTGVAVAASGTQTSATQMPGMPGMQGAGYWDDVAGEPFSGNGVVRRYYIAADQVAWDYAPLGRNAITGEPFDEVAGAIEVRAKAVQIAGDADQKFSGHRGNGACALSGMTSAL
jgi:hypothetical protein